MKPLTTIITAAVLLAASSEAQVGLNKLAQSTMNFQLVSIFPDASGMGEAFSAVGTGAEGMFYNPASVAEMEKTVDVAFGFTQWIADINYLGAGAAWNFGEYGAVGINALTVDYGTINGTSLVDPSQQALYPLGYVDNGPLSNVGAYSLGVSYSYKVNTQFFIGGNARYAGQNLGTSHFIDGETKNNDAAKLVFDAGVKYYTAFNSFRFGMAIRNFSSNIKREEVYDQLPLTFTMGGAIDLMDFFDSAHDRSTSLTLATDFLHSNNFSERVNIGLEYRFLGILALRGGYQTNRDVASWSAGIGLNTSLEGTDMHMDYSFSKMELFDNVNRVAVGFSL